MPWEQRRGSAVGGTAGPGAQDDSLPFPQELLSLCQMLLQSPAMSLEVMQFHAQILARCSLPPARPYGSGFAGAADLVFWIFLDSCV